MAVALWESLFSLQVVPHSISSSKGQAVTDVEVLCLRPGEPSASLSHSSDSVKAASCVHVTFLIFQGDLCSPPTNHHSRKGGPCSSSYSRKFQRCVVQMQNQYEEPHRDDGGNCNQVQNTREDLRQCSFQMSHLMSPPLYFKSTFYKVTRKCATFKTDQPLRFYLSYQCLPGLILKLKNHVSHSSELKCFNSF